MKFGKDFFEYKNWSDQFIVHLVIDIKNA